MKKELEKSPPRTPFFISTKSRSSMLMTQENLVDEEMIDTIYSHMIKSIHNGDMHAKIDKVNDKFVHVFKGKTLLKYLLKYKFVNRKEEDLGELLLKWEYIKSIEKKLEKIDSEVIFKNPLHKPTKKKLEVIRNVPSSINNYTEYVITQSLESSIMNNRRNLCYHSSKTKIDKLTRPYLFGFNILKAIVLHLRSAALRMKNDNSHSFINSKFTDDYNKFSRELIDLKVLQTKDWTKEEQTIFFLLLHNTLGKKNFNFNKI